MSKAFHYGGQAVIEGVMMRGRRSLAMAVRRPNGEMVVTTKPLSTLYTGKIRKTPLLRGLIVLIEALVLGMQALFQSANISLEEEKEEISGAMMWGILAVALIIAVAAFFVAPLFIARPLESYFNSSLVINILEGVIRIAIFILYLGAINLIPDIRKVFAYHGAEHKVVNAYEDGAPLEPEAVRRYSTAHFRCGTNFILIILVIAIFVFSLLPDLEIWLRVLSRIVLIPVIAAIGYEITQIGARYSHIRVVRTILRPGLALQALTTRQPSDAQLEVAISALKGAIEVNTSE